MQALKLWLGYFPFVVVLAAVCLVCFTGVLIDYVLIGVIVLYGGSMLAMKYILRAAGAPKKYSIFSVDIVADYLRYARTGELTEEKKESIDFEAHFKSRPKV